LRPGNVRACLEERLDHLVSAVERCLESDVMAIVGPIFPGLDDCVREAIENRKTSRRVRRASLAVMLETPGGVIEPASASTFWFTPVAPASFNPDERQTNVILTGHR
jgi:hypothetical protein